MALSVMWRQVPPDKFKRVAMEYRLCATSFTHTVFNNSPPPPPPPPTHALNKSDSYLLHGVLHQFVNVLVVLNSTLILKVTAKGEHDIVGPIVASCQKNVFNEGIHTLVHIVIEQTGIILNLEHMQANSL